MPKKSNDLDGFPAWAGSPIHPNSVPADLGFQAVPRPERRESEAQMSSEEREKLLNLLHYASTDGPPAPDPMDASIAAMNRSADQALAAKRASRTAQFDGQVGRLKSYVAQAQTPDPSIQGEDLPWDLEDDSDPAWREDEGPLYEDE